MDEEKVPLNKSDELYEFDKELDRLQNEEAPWNRDVRHFKKCEVNVLAAVKMLKHAMKGVEEGQSKAGMSVEVMGLLVGRVLYGKYIIMDAIELPVEGSENSVIASDDKVLTHMARVAERIEALRESRVVGWYHSHPFDYNPKMSNCFFSNVDIQNQLQWQIAYKKFVGIVVDPLRSIERGIVELGCFMAYPPNHTVPKDECPDGALEPNKEIRTKRWGSGCNSYYQLECSIFGGSLVNHCLNLMVRNHLFVRRLAKCDYLEADFLEGLPQKFKQLQHKLSNARNNVTKVREYLIMEAGDDDKMKKRPLHEVCCVGNRLSELFQAANIGQTTRDKLFLSVD